MRFMGVLNTKKDKAMKYYRIILDGIVKNSQFGGYRNGNLFSNEILSTNKKYAIKLAKDFMSEKTQNLQGYMYTHQSVCVSPIAANVYSDFCFSGDSPKFLGETAILQNFSRETYLKGCPTVLSIKN